MTTAFSLQSRCHNINFLNFSSKKHNMTHSLGANYSFCFESCQQTCNFLPVLNPELSLTQSAVNRKLGFMPVFFLVAKANLNQRGVNRACCSTDNGALMLTLSCLHFHCSLR